MYIKISSSVAALCVAASPVFAEVTPVQVWENLASYYKTFGYEVTEGAREEAGDTLTVSDVTMSTKTVDGASATVVVPKVVLQQTGDGNVRTVVEGDVTGNAVVKMPADADATDTATDETADPTATPDAETADTDTPALVDRTITFTASMPGNEMVSSGTPEAMSHAVNYPTMDFAVQFPVDDETTVPMTLAARDTTGSFDFAGTGAGAYKFDQKTGSVNLKVTASDIKSPETDKRGSADIDVTMTDFAVKGQADLPKGGLNVNDLNASFAAGATLSGDLAWGGINASFNVTAPNPETGETRTGSGTSKSGAGAVNFKLAQDGVSYGGSSKDTSVDFQHSDLPVPISYSLGESTFDVLFPVAKSEGKSPFKVKIGLTDLALADQVWGLFDPQGKLPHDPASMTFDATGTLKVVRDLFDASFNQRLQAASTVQEGKTALTPEQMAELAELQKEASPYVPEAMTINTWSLKAVGATADVKGDLTFPNGASTEVPVGTLTGDFTGVTTLIDSLAAMGFIPEEQVAGAKMMLMAFAKPVEGKPDALTTKLEFREGGQIFANGQQIK